ncbi:MAG: hypothetical protein A3E84_05210 [Gammaproteobacteria bacterium RIFCSPHIGHO2_12_FULL_42_13]|nr:MAG: hypothetical protein A3E84_05210 [Gammaproteobacteria bacterium RIFCSPHIGHO2_12_FULL_42_13]
MRLSVIIPVYNEVNTFSIVIERLLEKKISGIEIELIVIESNSEDGSRALALKYQHHPNVTLLLEDAPKGKGYAVRQGLSVATGDYIMIQDADLEYNLDDYEKLLSHILSEKHAFILGARCIDKPLWKMRALSGQPLISFFINAGHIFFTKIINLFFSVNLKDPFTMYKVFRRDCVEGLIFRCNRFEFDIELLVKIIRKGFIPIEIPVRYSARSYQAGKKVRIIPDALYLVRALFFLKFSRDF